MATLHYISAFAECDCMGPVRMCCCFPAFYFKVGDIHLPRSYEFTLKQLTLGIIALKLQCQHGWQGAQSTDLSRLRLMPAVHQTLQAIGLFWVQGYCTCAGFELELSEAAYVHHSPACLQSLSLSCKNCRKIAGSCLCSGRCQPCMTVCQVRIDQRG